MKKALLSTAIVCLFAIGASATVHTITVQNYMFTPATSTTAVVGDTILFQWINGDHTTTSTTIPAGAASWDMPMTSTATTFKYVPTVVGTYSFKCTPHESFGMVGSFSVTAPTAISNTPAVVVFTAYPNPTNSTLHISLPDATTTNIQLVNTNGGIVYKATIRQATDINTGNLANGMYFLSVQQGSAATVRAITVAH